MNCLRIVVLGLRGSGQSPDQKAVHEYAFDLCVAGDEICNWPEDGGPATLSQTHKHFYEKPANARTTGKQLAAALKRGGIG